MQYVHRESSNSGPDRRTGGHAHEYRVHLHRGLVVRRRPVSAVDWCRLHRQHGFHSEPLHSQSRPVLVRHHAAQVPAKEDHQKSSHYDIIGIEIRDVPDIWFRLAGYPAILKKG